MQIVVWIGTAIRLQGLESTQRRNMVEVYDRLYVGDGATCQLGSAQLAVVHACKSPCHQRAAGYTGSLPSTRPNYLVLQDPCDLYLNIIDPPLPLFKIETFAHFLLFASQHYDGGGSVLIHCNQGESRAPTLALVFLAKHLKVIPSDSFSAAKEAFVLRYEGYRPGLGIQQFLTKNWAMVGSS
jgi:hypothetical protein